MSSIGAAPRTISSSRTADGLPAPSSPSVAPRIASSSIKGFSPMDIDEQPQLTTFVSRSSLGTTFASLHSSTTHKAAQQSSSAEDQSSLSSDRPKRQRSQTAKALEAQEVEESLRRKTSSPRQELDLTPDIRKQLPQRPAPSVVPTSPPPRASSSRRSSPKSDEHTRQSGQLRFSSPRRLWEGSPTRNEYRASTSNTAASKPPAVHDRPVSLQQRGGGREASLGAEGSRKSSDVGGVPPITFYQMGKTLYDPEDQASAERSRSEASTPAAVNHKDNQALPPSKAVGNLRRNTSARVEYVWRAPSPPGRRAAIDADNIIESAEGRRSSRNTRLESEGYAAHSAVATSNKGVSRPKQVRTRGRDRLSDSRTHTAFAASRSGSPRVKGNGTLESSGRVLPEHAQVVKKRGRPRKLHPAAATGSSHLNASFSQASVVAPRPESPLSSLLEITDSSSDELETDSTPRDSISADSPTVSYGASNLAAPRRGRPAGGKEKAKVKRKVFLTAGLYAPDYKTNGTRNVDGRNSRHWRPSVNGQQSSSAFPEPIYFGQSLLTGPRDFQLPELLLQERNELRARVDSKRKPMPYRPIQKNRYYSRPMLNGELPMCQCDPRSNCGDDCLNRLTQFICHPKCCPCGDRCTNISLGKRPHAKCDVVWYGPRGFGLRTLEDIPQHGLVDEYRGEVINLAEVVRRMNDVYKESGNFYFLDYDTPAGEVLDGGLKGNITRFANHSCDPNCYIEKWLVCGTDEERTAEYQIGLFAARDIKAGEEITYDYGWSEWTKLRGFVENVDKELRAPEACHCGANNCVGVLGGKKQGATHRGSSVPSPSISASATPPSTMGRANSMLGKRGRDTLPATGLTRKVLAKKSPVKRAAQNAALIASKPVSASPASTSSKRLRLSDGTAAAASSSSIAAFSGRRSRHSMPAVVSANHSESEAETNLSRAATSHNSSRVRPLRTRQPASSEPVVLTDAHSGTGRSTNAKSRQHHLADGDVRPRSGSDKVAQSDKRVTGRLSLPGPLSSAAAGRLLANALRGAPLPGGDSSDHSGLGSSWANILDSEDETTDAVSEPDSESRRGQMQRHDVESRPASDVAMEDSGAEEMPDEDDEDWVDEDEVPEAPRSRSRSGKTSLKRSSSSKRADTLARTRAFDNNLTPEQRVQLGLPSWPLGKPDIGKDGRPVRYNPANRPARGPIKVSDYPEGTQFFFADGRPVNRSLVDNLSKQRYIYSGKELEEKKAKRRDKNAESARIRRLRKRYEELMSQGRTQQAKELANEESAILNDTEADSSHSSYESMTPSPRIPSSSTASPVAHPASVSTSQLPAPRTSSLVPSPALTKGSKRNKKSTGVSHTSAGAERRPQRVLPSRAGRSSQRTLHEDTDSESDMWEDLAESTPLKTGTRASASARRSFVAPDIANEDIMNASDGTILRIIKPNTGAKSRSLGGDGSSQASPSTKYTGSSLKTADDNRSQRRKSTGLSFTNEPLPAGRIGATGFIPGVPSDVVSTGDVSQADARRARNTFLARVRRLIQRGHDKDEAIKLASEMICKGHEKTPLAIAHAEALAAEARAGELVNTGSSGQKPARTFAPRGRKRGRPGRPPKNVTRLSQNSARKTAPRVRVREDQVEPMKDPRGRIVVSPKGSTVYVRRGQQPHSGLNSSENDGPTKRGPGRPRKSETTASANKASVADKGSTVEARKDSTIHSTSPSTDPSANSTVGIAVSHKRPRGRPRKSESDAAVAPAPEKRRPGRPRKSEPAPEKGSSPKRQRRSSESLPHVLSTKLTRSGRVSAPSKHLLDD